MLETFDKFPSQRGENGLQFREDPSGQFTVFLPVFLDPVEYLGLEVRYNKAFEELKKPALDNFQPVEPFLRFLKLAQEIGDGHLVRLFVQFLEFHGADLIVTALHGGGTEYLQDELLGHVSPFFPLF